MSARSIYAFDSFRVDLENRVLWNGDDLVPLSAKPFQTLVVLLENRDRIVEKAELIKAVWPDTYTEESNLGHQILAIRKALGEFHNGKQYIETISRRGYRFVGQVRDAEEALPEPEKPSYVAPVEKVLQTEAHPPIRNEAALRQMNQAWMRVVVPVVAILALVVIGAAFKTSFFPGPIRNTHQSRPLVQDAERNYLEGRFFWQKRTTSGYRTAIAHFEEAIRLDPNYAPAYAGLADSYILLGSFGIQPLSEVVPHARAAALRAIEIDDRSAEAHASMGYIMSRFDWDWEQADREFRRALELDPRYVTAHQWYSLHLITVGHTAEAISEIKQAQKLDPASLVMTADSALVLFYARRYDEAVQECQKALQMDSSFGLAHRTLGAVYIQQGRYREAIAEFEAATKLLGSDPWMIAETGRSYAMLGMRPEALSRLNELHELSGRRFVSPSAFALLSASLDDKRDESFQWLEKEFDQHSSLAILTVHPGFDPIRRDPRFQNLLRRIGLPQS